MDKMMKTARKRIYFYLSVIAIILFVFIIISLKYFLKKESEVAKEMAIARRAKIEKEYKERPSLKSAVLLTEKYIMLEDYDKALYYGKSALDLGANEVRIGVNVNLWIADVYNRLGNIDCSCYYLQRALELDETNIIEKNNYIGQTNLQDILDLVKLKRCSGRLTDCAKEAGSGKEAGSAPDIAR